MKVMSFNIHYGKGKDGQKDLHRIASIISKEGADLIGIQEADKYLLRSGFTYQLKKLASLTGFHYCYTPNIKLLIGGFGNGVLSKFPIISNHNISLYSSKEPRGALVAMIDTGSHKIKFINTHLGLVDDERVDQTNKILENINPEEPTILVGDFNSTPERADVQNILNNGLDDLYLNCKERGLLASDESSLKGYTFAYKSDVPNVRIDYIFATPKIKVSSFKVINTSASDHLPVLAEVEVK